VRPLKLVPRILNNRSMEHKALASLTVSVR
jgi:hypothetical protein